MKLIRANNIIVNTEFIFAAEFYEAEDTPPIKTPPVLQIHFTHDYGDEMIASYRGDTAMKLWNALSQISGVAL